MPFSLDPGTLCVALGRVLQIDGPDSLTHMRARDVATGNLILVPIGQIQPLPNDAAPSRADHIPEAEWKRAVALSRDLLPLNSRPFVTRSEFERLARRHKLSIRQLQRLRAQFVKDPRTSTLARDPGGRRNGASTLDPRVDSLIRHVIKKHYLKREKPVKEYVVVRAQSLARRLALAQPSRKAVLTRIKQELGWSADLAREGPRAAKQRWEPRTGGLAVDAALDLVQIDHTLADVMVVSEDRQTTLGRPWVTLAIDVATRCVLGLYVSMDAPSSVSVSLCIEHAVLPKAENEIHPGIWPMYGKPRAILVDNGKDFRSLAIQRGCEEHSIKLTWRPVRRPHYGAHIERLIGTLMRIAHLLSGTTFSNVRERGDYDSAGKARLTLDEFRDWLTQKICRFYHPRVHRELKVAPLIAWERAFSDASGRPAPPKLPADPLGFRMDFLPFKLRTIRRTGIELGGSRYWHEDLTPMLNSGESQVVRYDPRNPGQVWVRRRDGVLVTAYVIGGRAMGAAPSFVAAMDEMTRARLNAEIDKGFEITDGIEDAAERATREARRATERRTPTARQATSTEPGAPVAAPSRSLIQLEEWN